MSLIELLLSRKEVVLSLAVIGLILLVIVMLALTPALIRSWKKRTARQKAEKAARIARMKKNKRKQQANGAPRPRPIEAVAEQSTSASETVSLPVVETPAVPLPPPPVPETPIVPIPEVDEEEIPEATSSLQDVLDSVFTDDEGISRYEVLLKDVEPVSAEVLADLATQVAGELAALSAQRRL